MNRKQIAVWTILKLPSETAHEVLTLRMAEALAEVERSVTVFADSRHGFSVEEAEQRLRSEFALSQAVSFHLTSRRSSRGGGYFGEVATLFRIWRRKPSFLYASTPGIVPALATVFRIATILDLHSPVGGKGGRLLFRIFLRFGKNNQLVVANSRGLQELLVASFPSLTGQVLVAGNGVDRAGFAETADGGEFRRGLGIGATDPVVGYVGSLYPGRGVELIASLARANPNLSFLVVGSDGGTGVAGSLQGIENVFMAGRIPHRRVPSALTACDVLLMPYEENIAMSGGGDSATYMSPLKGVEYMASGRPIIASDLSAVRSVLGPESALYCQPDDLGDWQAALDLLLSDSHIGERIAAAALEVACERTWIARARALIAGLADAGSRDS